MASEPAAKKLKLPTLADAGQTLGAADAFLESLPGAQSSTSAASAGGNADGLAFGSCHLHPRLLSSTFPPGPLRPEAAAQLIRDFRALDSRPSLNVASFVTTQVEPECRELMAEALTINYIDEEEYPSTAQIHNQCVAQLGDLLSAEKDDDGDGNGKHCGTSTVGSSEAILLCYLAMKRRWQERRRAAGLPVAGVQCSVVSRGEGEEREILFLLFFLFFESRVFFFFFFKPRDEEKTRKLTARLSGFNAPPPPPHSIQPSSINHTRSSPPATTSATKRPATTGRSRCAWPR